MPIDDQDRGLKCALFDVHFDTSSSMGEYHERSQDRRYHRSRAGRPCRRRHVMERGLQPIVLEAGNQVGHAMRQRGHVQLFSPWEDNIDKAAARLLAATGWNSPTPDQYPTGAEIVERYLDRWANQPREAHIQTSSRVTGISRVASTR